MAAILLSTKGKGFGLQATATVSILFGAYCKQPVTHVPMMNAKFGSTKDCFVAPGPTSTYQGFPLRISFVS